MLAWMWGKGNIDSPLVQVQAGVAIVEIIAEVPNKTEISLL